MQSKNATTQPDLYRLRINPVEHPFYFAKMDRGLMLAMPSDSQYWQRQFWDRTFVKHDMGDRTGHVLQVNSGHNGRAGFPDEGIADDDVNAYEQSKHWLNRTWCPDHFSGAYYDHEPQDRDANGRLIESWSGRTTYTKADARFMNVAMEELSLLGLPLSNYGVPRVPKTARMNFFRAAQLPSARPLLHGCSWVQLNYYISPNYAGTGLRVPALAERGLRESIRQTVPLFRAVFPEQQIVPTVWATFRAAPNRHWFEIIFEEFARFPDLIKNILFWSNPHSNATFGGSADSSVMTDVYANRFEQVADIMKNWLDNG